MELRRETPVRFIAGRIGRSKRGLAEPGSAGVQFEEPWIQFVSGRCVSPTAMCRCYP